MSWPMAPLGAISQQIRGVTYKKADAKPISADGYEMLLRANNITDGGIVFDNVVYVPIAKVSTKQVLLEHDVVIAASSGSLKVVGKSAAFGGGPRVSFGAFCKAIRPDTSKVDPRYFAHAFRTVDYRRHVERRAAGANINNLRNEDIDEYEIPLPPLEDQRRIAGILDAADALRRRRREALALLDTLPGAIFAEMFGDPRDNPLGYPARKLSDLCSRITVGVVVRPASYYVNEGVPALRSVNVREGAFDLKDLKYFSQEANDGPLKKSKMRDGDVVIVRTGQPGRAAVVGEEIAGSNCIDMLIASPKEDELLPCFLEAFLNSDAGRQMALSNQTGQVQQHLNATALKGIDFITPPIEEQRKFARRTDEAHRVKEDLTRHHCELETLFSSLQSRAFAGEL